MGERVFKGEVGLAAVHGAEKDAERDQQQRAPDGVGQHLGECSAFPLPAPDGIGEGHAYQEGEGGLNHVMHGTAGPLGMGLVEGKNLPEETVIEVCVDFRKLQHFSHHQQHDQATVGIDGEITHRSDIVERTEFGGNNGLWDCYRGLLRVQYLMHRGSA